jgi:hypothetical protein
MDTLSPRERIALALTAPCLLVMAASFLSFLGSMAGLPEVAGLADLVVAFVGSLSVFFSAISLVYLIISFRVLRAFIQVPCWIVNIAWLAFCFRYLFPHSIRR